MKRLLQALTAAALGLALAAPVSAEEAAASLTITELSPTRRLNESIMLGFGGPKLNDRNTRDAIVPGGRATLLFSDTQGQNSTPDCVARSAPYPTTLCGAKVVITYTFSSDTDPSNTATAKLDAELISVNAFDKNRIDLIVPNPDTVTNLPSQYRVKSAEVSLELNGRQNDPAAVSQSVASATRPAVLSEPSIFVDQWGLPKITRPNGSQVSPSNPTKPGELVTVWGTGFGSNQPRTANTPNLKDWDISVNEELVRITAAEKHPAGGLETLQFVVPPTAEKCDYGACVLFLSQKTAEGLAGGAWSYSTELFVNTPPPEILSMKQRVLTIDHLSDYGGPWEAEFLTKLLTPGSFATVELSSAGCSGNLQGALAESFPKPVELCGVKFLFRADGAKQAFEAPLYAYASTVVVLQVPMEMNSAQSGTVSVAVNGKEVSIYPVTFTEMEFISQGLLTPEEDSAIHPDNLIRPGDELNLIGFGLGQTTPPIATNTPGGDQYQFPSLVVKLSGGGLTQPMPVKVLSAAKKAPVLGDPGTYKWEKFQNLGSELGSFYFGPVLRDWIRFQVPSNLNSGKYSVELCQNGMCSYTPSFWIASNRSFGQLCVRVKTSNRVGKSAGLGGVIVSDAYGLGSGVTDSSGQMCFGSAPTGTKYLISAERVGFTFLNRKLSGTITEGNQVAELTAYPRASGKSTAKKTKKKKLRAKRTSRR